MARRGFGPVEPDPRGRRLAIGEWRHHGAASGEGFQSGKRQSSLCAQRPDESEQAMIGWKIQQKIA
jgi:hypothetical protein